MSKHKPPFLRSAYNYDTDEASNETGLACPEPTLTQQQFAEESDINFIAERYGLTGELPQVLDLPRYGDFTGIFDFQSAQNAVVQAKQQFMTLPAKLRARFDNDPGKMMAFLDDPENRAEAEFMGLLKKPENAPESPTGNAGGEPKGPPPSGPEKAPPAKPSKQAENGKTDT